MAMNSPSSPYSPRNLSKMPNSLALVALINQESYLKIPLQASIPRPSQLVDPSKMCK